MPIRLQLAAAALLVAAPSLGAPAKKPSSAPAPSAAVTGTVDASAMAALDRSRAYLRTLRGFELRAEMTIDEVEDGDLNLELLNRARYDFAAPDKLFIEWKSDRIVRQLYFDGKSATLLAPRLGYYATVQRPGTVENLLVSAWKDYGIVFPLPDILLWAAKGPQRPANLQRAIDVGYARLAGVDTDHYVFRTSDTDWQVWIERGDRPLPRKIVVTTRDDPAKPRFSALLQWNLDPAFAPNQFAFTPPPGSASVGMVKITSPEASK